MIINNIPEPPVEPREPEPLEDNAENQERYSREYDPVGFIEFCLREYGAADYIAENRKDYDDWRCDI
jgi:hypothetical protein